MYLAVRLASRLISPLSLIEAETDSLFLSFSPKQEDRILCWELVAKRGSAWLLHYQRSAYAVTVRLVLFSFAFVFE